MTTQFISKTARKLPEPERIDDVYAMTAPQVSSMKLEKPSFAPFSTGSRRPMTEANFEVTPPPGTYDIATTLHNKQNLGTSFKSTRERFTDGNNDDFNAPPPGTYVLPSSIKNGRPKQFARPYHDLTESHIPRSVSVPTIPTKSQALGYEVQANGVLRKSTETFAGFKGTPDDAPGPFDYDPPIKGNYKSHAATLKGAGRNNLNKAAEKEALSKPGPGYYTVKSPFDMILNNDDEDGFVIKLNNARRKESFMFASKTNKNLFEKASTMNIDEPGPGYYELPRAINAPAPKPVNQQFFASKDVRFKSEVCRSLEVKTAPGMYTIPSNIEMQKYKILKKKKMTSRSGWAQTISFESTEGRTIKQFEANDVPPPTAYVPKQTMADSIPHELRTGGGFGGKDMRFKPPKPYSATTEAQKRANELNEEISPYLEGRSNIGAKTAMSKKPSFTSNFAPNPEERFKPPRTPPGPAPTAYDTTPSWKKGTAQLVPNSFDQSKKRVEVRPGPGDYSISRPQKFINRKNVMVSSQARDVTHFLVAKRTVPGPGRYDPEPVYNNMIKSSHNILLSGMY